MRFSVQGIRVFVSAEIFVMVAFRDSVIAFTPDQLTGDISRDQASLSLVQRRVGLRQSTNNFNLPVNITQL